MTQNPVSLQVSLPQMLDLALGTPEVGSINLNILHNFLHVILHQINLANLKIEYRGDDAERIKTIISSLKTGPSVHLHEYSITDGSGNVIKRPHTPESSVTAEIYTSESKTSAKLEKPNGYSSPTLNVKETKGVKERIGIGVEESRHSVIFVEPVKDGAVPSALRFKKINESVEKLERQFRALEELATNPEIIERIKTSRPDPLNDMWSIINIKKRLDASEQGISKLMTMLQDIIKSDDISTAPLSEKQESVSFKSIIDNSTPSNDRLTKIETDLININEEMLKIKEMLEVKEELPETEHEFLQEHVEEYPKIRNEVYSDSEDMSELMRDSETQTVGYKLSDVSNKADQVEIRAMKPEGKFSPQLSAVSGLATAGSASGEDKTVIKSNLSDISSKIPSSESKRSNISSSVLNDLKLDITALKSDIGQTKQDIEDLRYQVEQMMDQEPVPEKSIKTESNVSTNNEVKPAKSSSKRSSGSKEPVEPKYSSSYNAEVSPSAASNTSLPGSKELGATDSRFTSEEKRKSKSVGTVRSLRDSRLQNFDESIKNLESRIVNLEQRQSVGTIKSSRNSLMQNFDESIKNLESQILDLEQKVQAVGDERKIIDSSHTEEVQNLDIKIKEIDNEVKNLKQLSDVISQEKEKSDVLIEQIELLKILKADKEDLEDALTDKADAEIVNRKVSNDRFDSACNDLARNLESTVSKLTEQENILNNAFSAIHEEIDNKLDRVELSPLEEFINNQFQVFQEKLEELEEEKQKNEAAGTKKILNDVLCISCNNNVVMRMNQGPIYKNNFMTYNSDRMKKQLKQFPGKNINQFTALIKDNRRKKTQRNMIEKSSKDHFCNRYCGGSHTITTAQQRVMRPGGFPSEWPEILNPGISITSQPICKPEKNVCCSAFNDQLAAINQNSESKNQQKQNDQKLKSGKNLGRQESKKNQSRQDSLNSKNILPTVIDNEGNVQ